MAIRNEQVWSKEQLASLSAMERDLFQKLAGILAKPVFIAPTLLNSWVNYDSGHATAGYYRDPLGIVHIKGLIKNGTAAGGTVLFTLPEFYRPSSTLVFPCISYNGVAYVFTEVDVQPDGDLVIGVASNTWLALNNVSFVAV